MPHKDPLAPDKPATAGKDGDTGGGISSWGQILNKAALVEAGQPKLSVESILALEAIQNESPQLANKYFRN